MIRLYTGKPTPAADGKDWPLWKERVSYMEYRHEIKHFITPADYEAAGKYVSNPEEYDFKKILNW